jgi:hypothetical protein
MAIDIEAPGANEADLEAALFARAPFRGARARRTSDQTTANYTTETAVPWQEAAADTDGFWSAGTPSRLTVPAAYNGKYANAQAHVRIDATTTDTWKKLRVVHRDSGGTTKFSAGNATEIGAVSAVYLSANLIGVPLATGDYFEAMLQEESDSSITIVSGQASGLALQIIG